MVFTCERCGFCCQLDVRLSEKDIRRLAKKAQRKDFTITKDGSLFLRREHGYCVFYDGRCSVYSLRPDICRRFPAQSDGSISPKCRQRRDFSARVDRKVVMFINAAEENPQ